MYEHFFKLRAEPFRLSPDHRFCYNHAQYAKAKAYMAYAFMRAEGFVMITGQPGTGKTTLIGDLVESLADENVVVANLSDRSGHPIGFGQFLRYGVVVTIVSLLLATGYVWLRYL